MAQTRPSQRWKGNFDLQILGEAARLASAGDAEAVLRQSRPVWTPPATAPAPAGAAMGLDHPAMVAALALGAFADDDRAADALVKLFHGDRRDVRRAAASLGFATPDAARSILHLVLEGDAGGRGPDTNLSDMDRANMAAALLGHLGTRESLELLERVRGRWDVRRVQESMDRSIQQLRRRDAQGPPGQRDRRDRQELAFWQARAVMDWGRDTPGERLAAAYWLSEHAAAPDTEFLRDKLRSVPDGPFLMQEPMLAAAVAAVQRDAALVPLLAQQLGERPERFDEIPYYLLKIGSPEAVEVLMESMSEAEFVGFAVERGNEQTVADLPEALQTANDVRRRVIEQAIAMLREKLK